MKTNTKENLLFLAMICLTIVCLIGALRYSAKCQDLELQVSDLSVQLAHSKVPMQRDTIRDSIPVVSQRVIEIDKSDFKQLEEDKKLIKDLGLKVDQLVSENKMLREARDSVQLKAVNDSVFAYHDHWADFEYLTRQQLLKYAVRDSFVTNVSRIYKHRFLWWRWGTKGYQVHHVNFNPNVDIKYDQYIMIKR
jgi:hypothetical protein